MEIGRNVSLSTYLYLAAVEKAAPSALAPYRLDFCPECSVPEGSLNFDRDSHAVKNGAVIVGCEGGRLVEPEAVGYPNAGWQDWRPFCSCGCGERVPEEGNSYSEECDLYPEIPFPSLARTATQTWAEYLDSCR